MQQFTDDLTFNLTGYTNDIDELVNSMHVYITNDYSYLLNDVFNNISHGINGRVQGFEVTIRKVGAHRKPPFRPPLKPKRDESGEPPPTNWHDAMQGLETAKFFCATFRTDNKNRITKTAEELGLSQEEYAAQLLKHYGQLPDFVHLEDTLNRAIDILSGITYRKFEALRDDK